MGHTNLNTTQRYYKIFEDLLDDLESSDAFSQEDSNILTKLSNNANTTIEDIDNFPFLIQFKINHIDLKYRVSNEDFLQRLKLFNDYLCQYNYFQFVDSMSQLLYIIKDNGKLNYTYFDALKEDDSTYFQFNDLDFYSNEDLIKNRVTENTQFNVIMGIKFNNNFLNYNNLIRFVKRTYQIIKKSISISFPKANFAKIYIFRKYDDNHIKEESFEGRRFLDFINALDTTTIRNSYEKLQKIFFKYANQQTTDQVFQQNNQKYSTFAQLIIKELNLDEKRFIFDDTKYAFFVYIPVNQKLSISSFQMKNIFNYKKKYNKNFILNDGGTLNLIIYYLEDKSYLTDDNTILGNQTMLLYDFLNNCLESNCNHLTLKIWYVKTKEPIDLTKFFIKDLKIIFKEIKQDSDDQGKRYIPEIKFLQKPQKMKIIDNTKYDNI